MYFGIVEKVKITKDEAVVNSLLAKGWTLIDVVSTYKKEYLFLLGAFDENREIKRPTDCG